MPRALTLLALAFCLNLLLSSCGTSYATTQPATPKGRFYATSKRLSEISNLPDYNWKFKLESTSEPVFAWHKSGNLATITLSQGLVDATKSEHELAILLGQAMAHVSLRHPNSQDFTKYNDYKIREADRLGMAYAAKAIYYPRPAKQLWRRLQKQYGNNPYVGFHWTDGREETYTWNIEPIMRLYNGRKNNTVF